MKYRKTLLHNLLDALVQEWGYEEVRFALRLLSDTHGRPDARSLGPESKKVRRMRRTVKLLASEQVARAKFPEEQEVILRELAIRFDRKQFLPSIADVREFLIMMGEKPTVMRDRSVAFRRLLNVLSGLPAERLTQLVNSSSHSGPSQLGPLSDAISAVGASLPRHRDPAGS